MHTEQGLHTDCFTLRTNSGPWISQNDYISSPQHQYIGFIWSSGLECGIIKRIKLENKLIYMHDSTAGGK